MACLALSIVQISLIIKYYFNHNFLNETTLAYLYRLVKIFSVLEWSILKYSKMQAGSLNFTHSS